MSIELMAIAECMAYTDGGFKATIRGREIKGMFTLHPAICTEYPAIYTEEYSHPTDVEISNGKHYPRLEKLIAGMIEKAYERLTNE